MTRDRLGDIAEWAAISVILLAAAALWLAAIVGIIAMIVWGVQSI